MSEEIVYHQRETTQLAFLPKEKKCKNSTENGEYFCE